MEYEYAALEEEMISFVNHLLYDTTLDVDAVRVRFYEQFGDENADFLEEILNEM